MRALVLGGSGHVGNAIARELVARGAQVRVARRGRTAAANLAGLAVTDAIGDAEDPAALDRWIAGCDAVFDAAAPYPLSVADRGAIEASARRAARLVDAIARHRARLVHVGSFVTRLGTDAAGRPIDPSRRLDAELHPYFAAKRAGEAVLAAAAQTGAPIAIVHPTTCMGPWDSRPDELGVVPSVLAGRLAAVPSHVINVVDVRDVARGAVAAAAVSSPAWATLAGRAESPILLSGHNVGLPELCRLIGELAGVRVAVRAVPSVAARAAAWAVELAAPGAAPPLLLPTLLALRQSSLPVGAAQRVLGAAPRPLSATLRDAIAWYRDRTRDAPDTHDSHSAAPRPRPAVI